MGSVFLLPKPEVDPGEHGGMCPPKNFNRFKITPSLRRNTGSAPENTDELHRTHPLLFAWILEI